MTQEEIETNIELILKKLDLIASKIEWNYQFKIDGTKEIVYLKDSEEWGS